VAYINLLSALYKDDPEQKEVQRHIATAFGMASSFLSHSSKEDSKIQMKLEEQMKELAYDSRMRNEIAQSQAINYAYDSGFLNVQSAHERNFQKYQGAQNCVYATQFSGLMILEVLSKVAAGDIFAHYPRFLLLDSQPLGDARPNGLFGSSYVIDTSEMIYILKVNFYNNY